LIKDNANKKDFCENRKIFFLRILLVNIHRKDLSARLPEQVRSQSGGHLPIAPAVQAGARQAGFGENAAKLRCNLK
jgi:hypothetical protein